MGEVGGVLGRGPLRGKLKGEKGEGGGGKRSNPGNTCQEGPLSEKTQDVTVRGKTIQVPKKKDRTWG